jgi:hypothetical protein
MGARPSKVVLAPRFARDVAEQTLELYTSLTSGP